MIDPEGSVTSEGLALLDAGLEELVVTRERLAGLDREDLGSEVVITAVMGLSQPALRFVAARAIEELAVLHWRQEAEGDDDDLA